MNATNRRKKLDISETGHGRLAQLVERNIDVVDVRGSNPLPPTDSQEMYTKDTSLVVMNGRQKHCFWRVRKGSSIFTKMNVVSLSKWKTCTGPVRTESSTAHSDRTKYGYWPADRRVTFGDINLPPTRINITIASTT